MPGLTASPTTPSGAGVRSLLALLTVLLVAVAGYGGFRLAARIDLSAETGAGLVVLAVITGFAVFFSPCSFPLLIALLARPGGGTYGTQQRRTSLSMALAMGAGASLFLLIVGAVVGVAGEGIAHSVGFTTVPGRVLRAAVAAIILIAGLVQLGVLQVPLWRVTRLAAPIERRRAAISSRHEHRAQVLYGFGFVLAGFGWTGPLLVGLASQAAITGGITSAVTAFAIAAATLVLTIGVASIALTAASDSQLQSIQTQAPVMKRSGGVILIMVGTWFAYLAVANPTYLLP